MRPSWTALNEALDETERFHDAGNATSESFHREASALSLGRSSRWPNVQQKWQDGYSADEQVPIIDQPPADAETIPAFLDFKPVVKSTDESVKHEDPTQQHRIGRFKAARQCEAIMRMPPIDFTFKTVPWK
jgi:hypothetical protein